MCAPLIIIRAGWLHVGDVDAFMADPTSLPWLCACLARGGILEALPDRPDPAMLGGIQPVARELMTVQGIRWAGGTALLWRSSREQLRVAQLGT
jgi:hypothetical protein